MEVSVVRGALDPEAIDKLRGQVLGVRGAAAIAEQQDLPTLLKGAGQDPGDRGHLLGLLGHQPVFELIGLGHCCGKACRQGHGDSGFLEIKVKGMFKYKKLYEKGKLIQPGRIIGLQARRR
jgi:hypothetical protein